MLPDWKNRKDVENRDYHYLSQSAIANAKRILTTLILDQDTSVTLLNIVSDRADDAPRISSFTLTIRRYD